MTNLRAIQQREHAAVCPNRRLFISVILNAVLDASGDARALHGAQQVVNAQAEAFAWIRDGGDDFKMVCHLAELNPAAVQEKALAYIARLEGAERPRGGHFARFLAGGTLR